MTDLKNHNIAYLKNQVLDFSDLYVYNTIKNINRFKSIIITTNLSDNINLKDIKLYFDKKFSVFLSNNYPYITKKQLNLYENYIEYCLGIINKEKISILHILSGLDALFYLKLKRLTNLPYIVSSNRDDFYNFNKQKCNIYKTLFENADLFLVCSKKLKNFLIELGCSKEKIVIFPLKTIRDNNEIRIQKNKLENIYDSLISSITIPSEFQIETTLRCNLNCENCYQASFRSNSEESKEFKFQDLKKIIEENNPKIILLSGGEPFLRNDLLDIIDYCEDKKVKVRLLTNCSLLDDKLITYLQNKKNIESIYFSLDSGIPEEHDKIRKKGNFKQTLKAIEKLSNKLNIIISSVFFGFNKDGIKKLIEFCTKNKIFINLLIDELYTKEEIDESKKTLYSIFNKEVELFVKKPISKEKIEKIEKEFLDLVNYAKKNRCLSNYTQINRDKTYFCSAMLPSKYRIDSYGNFIGCRVIRESFGNINKDTLDSVIKSNKHKKFRKEMLANIPLPICKRCPKLVKKPIK